MYIETKKKLTGERIDGAERYSKREFGVLKSQDALDKLLEQRSKDLHAASAYWGHREGQAFEPDDKIQDLFRFKPEMNRKLMPLSREPQTSFPKHLDFAHVGLHLLPCDGNSYTGGLNKSQLEKCGDVGSKPRFLNLQTEYMRMPHKFDPEVLDEEEDGKRKENMYDKDRDKLKRKEFDSEDPNYYQLTSDDYCDMSKIDPSSHRVEDDWDTISKLPLNERLYKYKSRWNNVNREGPTRREKTMMIMEKEHEVDPNALREIMMKERLKDMPRGYVPPKTEWLSTTHREHADYDLNKAREANDPDSTAPLRNKNYALTPEHIVAVERRDERAKTKLDGDWQTECGEGYQDRFQQAEINKEHAGKSVFDVKYGVYTMNHEFHHPRSDVHTQEVYKPHQLVPQQYVSMATEPLMAKNQLHSLSTQRN